MGYGHGKRIPLRSVPGRNYSGLDRNGIRTSKTDSAPLRPRTELFRPEDGIFRRKKSGSVPAPAWDGKIRPEDALFRREKSGSVPAAAWDGKIPAGPENGILPGRGFEDETTFTPPPPLISL